MDGVTLLAEARAAGLSVALDGERLVVRGPRRGAPLAERLIAAKAVVIAALADGDASVAWRVAALRPKVPRRGAIPFLAVLDSPPPAGACLSCGEPLPKGARFRCSPCLQAVRIVLAEVREGVASAAEPANPE